MSRRVPLLITAGAVGLAVATAPTAQGLVGTDAGRSLSAVSPRWVAVSGPVPVTTTPDTLRVGANLQVIWSQTDGTTDSVRVRTLDAKGKPVGPAHTVVEGWLAVNEDPKLFLNGTEQVAAFAGIHSYSSTGYTGPMVSARSADGASWALAPGKLTQSTAAQSAANIDAIDDGGEPFVAFTGFTPAPRLHRGFITGAPTDTPDFNAAEGGSYFLSLARDKATGQVWAAWHSPNGDPSQVGTRVQRVWPQPADPAVLAPGSATAAGQSSSPGQPVAFAAREGGGLWIAYQPRWPTSRTIRLWRVGSSRWIDVPGGGTVDNIALAAAPGGRLWLSWGTVGDGARHAARSNPSVTRLGTVRHLTQPGGPSSQVNQTTTDGIRGPLDIIASTQVAGAGVPTLYALQVLPALTVTATPTRLSAGTLRVKVADAGSPVAGAAVTFRGTTARTSARGTVALTVSAKVKDGRYGVKVEKSGYAASVVRVRVT